MKQSSFILSLVIPGPSSPEMNIDVYLQPRISELQELWNVGVRTFDVSMKNYFVLRAALIGQLMTSLLMQICLAGLLGVKRYVPSVCIQQDLYG
jgi:hypothetical protein